MNNISRLEECFRTAIENDMKYIAVKVKILGFPKEEIIINEIENFEKKLEYYRKTYNEDLVLKGNNGIEIVDFCCADDFEDIEHDLIYSYN